MKKYLKFFVTALSLTLLGVGCNSFGGFFLKPNMTVDKFTIKVGETLTITMIAPTIDVTGGNTNLTQVDTGFIYSPKLVQTTTEPTAPYINLSIGFVVGSEPKLFPIDPDLEVVSPVTGSDNVPSQVTTTRVGDQSKVTFVLKGKSVGTAVIRGGFLNTTVENPNHTERKPAHPEYDGEVTIQVVP